MTNFQILLPSGRDVTKELPDFDRDRILAELHQAYTERVAVLQ
jgi:hypothetical protein